MRKSGVYRVKGTLKLKKEAALFFGEQLRRSLVSGVIAKIVLFGSVVAGRAKEDSDIDVVVVGTRVLKSILDVCADAQLETWLKFHEAVEPLVYPIESLRRTDNFFLQLELRNRARYERSAEIDVEKASETIKMGDELLKLIEERLKEKGNPT